MDLVLSIASWLPGWAPPTFLLQATFPSSLTMAFGGFAQWEMVGGGKKEWTVSFTMSLSSFSSPLCLPFFTPLIPLLPLGAFSISDWVLVPCSGSAPHHTEATLLLRHHKCSPVHGSSSCRGQSVWSRRWAAGASPPLVVASCVANVCHSVSQFFQHHCSHFTVLNSFVWNTYGRFCLPDQNSSEL